MSSCATICAVVGDVNIDYVTDLSQCVLDGATSSCLQNSIQSSVGGNAVFFAEASREAGFAEIWVFCSVGDDLPGRRVLNYLSNRNMNVANKLSAKSTGQVLIIYQPDDQRIMIADRGANVDLGVGAIELPSQLSTQPDLLYVSGYSLLDGRQREGVRAFALKMRESGASVVVDIVPHDIWKTMSWSRYVSMCSPANCVMVELDTLSAFAYGRSDLLGPDDAVELLLRWFEFCILRINDVSEFVVADRSRSRTFAVPYRRLTASLRFTDRVLAGVMQQYIRDSRGLFDSDDWLLRVVKIVSEAG